MMIFVRPLFQKNDASTRLTIFIWPRLFYSFPLSVLGLKFKNRNILQSDQSYYRRPIYSSPFSTPEFRRAIN